MFEKNENKLYEEFKKSLNNFDYIKIVMSLVKEVEKRIFKELPQIILDKTQKELFYICFSEIIRLQRKLELGKLSRHDLPKSVEFIVRRCLKLMKKGNIPQFESRIKPSYWKLK